MKKFLLATTAVLVGLPLIVVATCVSAWVHFHEPVGRRAFGELIGAVMTGMLPGRFTLEGVQEVDLPRVRADRLRVRAPGGPDVMVLRDVDVDLDVLASVWHGGPIIPRAHVDGGGVILLTKAPSGKMWIELAFDSPDENRRGQPKQEQGGPPWYAPPGDHVLRIDDIRFRALNVRVNMGGPRAQLQRARGRGRIWLEDQSKVQMRYWSVRGDLRTEGIPDARLWGFALTVDPLARRKVRFVSQLDALDSHMALAGHSPGPNDAGVRACLYTGGPSLATIIGLGAELLTGALTSSVSLDVRPSDPPRRPQCDDGDEESSRRSEVEEREEQEES